MKKKAAFVLLCLCMICSNAWGQRLHIDVRATDFKKLKVAMPAFEGNDKKAREAWDVCATDVRMSGAFELLDPKTYINPGPVGRLHPGTLKDWTLIGADYVIVGNIKSAGKNIAFDVQAVELATGKMLVRKRYKTTPVAVNRAVHHFMDDFLDRTLGLAPIYSSKMIFALKNGEKKQATTSWCDGTGIHTIRGLGDLVLNPAWSPDMKGIAFVSYWRDNPDLYYLDFEKFKVRVLSSTKGINTTPAFHPSGKKVALTMTKDGNPDIYMLDLEKGSLERLTRSWATDTSPSFSPDGKRIVFCSSRGGGPQIYVMELESRKIQRISFKGRYNTEPVFSPRGDLIAFTHASKDRHFHIALIKPDGSFMKVLPGTGNGDEAPTFSPDGRLVAFSSSDGNIYVSDLVGNDPVRITDGKGEYTEPSWSPVLR